MDFQLLMTTKSEEGLQDYLNNYTKYVPDAIEAAVTELKNRGRVFTEEEVTVIQEKIAERKATIKKEEGQFWENEHNVALHDLAQNDEDIVGELPPKLYSKTTITVFSVLFGVLFGAILLAINISSAGGKKGKGSVIFFSIFYTFASVILMRLFFYSFLISILFSFIGALILNRVFWPKYIGDKPHFIRPPWVPLLIGIMLIVLFVTFLNLSGLGYVRASVGG